MLGDRVQLGVEWNVGPARGTGSEEEGGGGGGRQRPTRSLPVQEQLGERTFMLKLS